MSLRKTAKKTRSKVIHIDGIPGSGKSYILGKIHSAKIATIDTDDIYHMVVKDMSKTRKFRKWYANPTMPYPTFDTKLKKTLHDSVKKSHAHVVIIAGMTVPLFQTPIEKYFIRIDDLEATYKRFISREIEKIKAVPIEKLIKTTDVDFLGPAIEEMTGQSGQFPMSFSTYKTIYETKLREARDSGYTIATQGEIIECLFRKYDS